MGFWRQQIYPYPLASLGQFHKESSVSFGYEPIIDQLEWTFYIV